MEDDEEARREAKAHAKVMRAQQAREREALVSAGQKPEAEDSEELEEPDADHECDDGCSMPCPACYDNPKCKYCNCDDCLWDGDESDDDFYSRPRGTRPRRSERLHDRYPPKDRDSESPVHVVCRIRRPDGKRRSDRTTYVARMSKEAWGDSRARTEFRMNYLALFPDEKRPIITCREFHSSVEPHRGTKCASCERLIGRERWRDFYRIHFTEKHGTSLSVGVFGGDVGLEYQVTSAIQLDQCPILSSSNCWRAFDLRSKMQPSHLAHESYLIPVRC